MAEKLIIEREIRTIFIKQLLRRDINSNTKISDVDSDELYLPEIITSIEDFFEINIPIHDWHRFETVGEVIEYVCARIHTQ